VTHLAAALFFTLALLGAAVAIHLTLRQYWDDILRALRGELGLGVRPPARPEPGSAMGFGRAAF
jgi:hypothetical protein